MSAIAFDRVTLAIADRTILEDITLDIAEGEFVGVLGANGAGKTTLMRAILGLLRPRSGSIGVFGAPATRGSGAVGSSRVDLQACKLEYSIVSPK